MLKLKLELQSIRKGNEPMNSYLQRIKTTRDKLSIVGVHIDNEELLHIILKGLPKEYAPFASSIGTRDGVLSLEKRFVLLQIEEQSMKKGSNPLMNSALAMFTNHTNKPTTSFNGNPSYNRGRGRNSFQQGRGGRSPNSLHHNLHINNRLNLLLKENLRDLLVKFFGIKDTMLLIITTD